MTIKPAMPPKNLITTTGHRVPAYEPAYTKQERQLQALHMAYNKHSCTNIKDLIYCSCGLYLVDRTMTPAIPLIAFGCLWNKLPAQIDPGSLMARHYYCQQAIAARFASYQAFLEEIELAGH